MVASYYAWDPEFDCITEETSAAGAITARYTQEPRPYGGLVSQRRGSATSYYHYDNVGTTRVLTNQAQSTTLQTTYTAFGENVNTTGATVNPFGFGAATGYLAGTMGTSLYVRLRQYAPGSSLWLSIDPSDDDSNQSSYVYCGNRPLLYIDPEGDVKRPTIRVDQQPRGGVTTGNVKIQIIEQEKLTLGDCGNFRWTIQWLLKRGSGFNLKKGGYFVQHINTLIAIYPCENPRSPKLYSSDFWEAWATNPPAKIGGPASLATKYADAGDRNDDTFKYENIEDNTYGTITYFGQYGYVEGPIPKPPFEDSLTCRTFGAGKLPCSQTDPTLPPYNAVILGRDSKMKLRRHVIKVRWDCCACSKGK